MDWATLSSPSRSPSANFLSFSSAPQGGLDLEVTDLVCFSLLSLPSHSQF